MAKQIEEAYIEDERAKSAAGSAAASVEVTALRDMTLEVGDEIVALAVNEINRTLVEDEAVLTIPDVAQIRVSAGPSRRDWRNSVGRLKKPTDSCVKEWVLLMRLRREGLRRNDRTPSETRMSPSRPSKESFETSLPMFCLVK